MKKSMKFHAEWFQALTVRDEFDLQVLFEDMFWIFINDFLVLSE